MIHSASLDSSWAPFSTAEGRFAPHHILVEGPNTYLTVLSDTVQGTSKGRSASFNAATSTMSFANDFLVASAFSDDPIVGAAVDLHSFVLDLATTESASVIFRNSSIA